VWGFVGNGVVAWFESELRADLGSHRWDVRYGAPRTLPKFDGSLRLVIGRDQSQSVSRAGVNP